LPGTEGIAALAAEPTGTDGGAGSAEDPAGALVDGDTVARAQELGLDPAAFLADNDSTGFFERLGDLLRSGPTFTNVNDFRAIVVDSPSNRRNPKADDADRPNQRVRSLLPRNGCGCRRRRTHRREPIRPLPIFACATIPAAAWASRSVTRTPKGWTTEGWWNLSARSCETAGEGPACRALLLCLCGGL
jgi:hypothetical protein